MYQNELKKCVFWIGKGSLKGSQEDLWKIKEGLVLSEKNELMNILIIKIKFMKSFYGHLKIELNSNFFLLRDIWLQRKFPLNKNFLTKNLAHVQFFRTLFFQRKIQKKFYWEGSFLKNSQNFKKNPFFHEWLLSKKRLEFKTRTIKKFGCQIKIVFFS